MLSSFLAHPLLLRFTHSSFMEFDHIGVHSLLSFPIIKLAHLDILQWLMMLTFTSAVVADVLIAAALVFCLLQSRSKSMSADCSLFHRFVSLSHVVI